MQKISTPRRSLMLAPLERRLNNLIIAYVKGTLMTTLSDSRKIAGFACKRLAFRLWQGLRDLLLASRDS